MQRLTLLALFLAIAHGADAASLTPPNLVAASSLNNPDLLLVWPYASGGPLEAMSWSTFKGQMISGLTGSFLAPANNLSDVGNPTIVRTNLGLGSAALANTGTSGASICQLSSACTWSALQSFAASSTSAASINLAPGVAPTSPNNGDEWITSAGAFARVNGQTHQLDAGAVNGIVQGSGAGAVSAVTVGTGLSFSGGTLSATSTTVSGTWTPVVSYATPGSSSVAYTTHTGSFFCTAGLVTATMNLVFNFTQGTGSGNFQISLPNSYTFADTAAVGGAFGNLINGNFSAGAVFYLGALGPVFVIRGGNNPSPLQAVSLNGATTISATVSFATGSGTC